MIYNIKNSMKLTNQDIIIIFMYYFIQYKDVFCKNREISNNLEIEMLCLIWENIKIRTATFRFHLAIGRARPL